MCERKNGYFGFSKEELKKNPQLRALVDDGVVAENGWSQPKEGNAQRQMKDLEKQTDCQLPPYDSAR